MRNQNEERQRLLAAARGSAALWDDPYLAARQNRIEQHHSVKEIGSLENSCDGSGPWIAVHLLDVNGRFVQGGWLPPNTELKHGAKTYE